MFPSSLFSQCEENQEKNPKNKNLKKNEKQQIKNADR
jgi:hypothetical protein